MRISLDLEGQKILGKGSVGADLGPAVRSIVGVQRKGQDWSWPLSLGNCRQLRSIFGRELEVDPDLARWAATVHRTGRAVGGQLPAHITAALNGRPYQWEAAKRIAAQPAIAVLDEPGLGKTLETMAGLMLAGAWEGRHLVLCPKGAIFSTWAAEIIGWTDGKVYAMTGDAKTKRVVLDRFMADDTGARFLVTNPETLRTQVGKFCPKCEKWMKPGHPTIVPSEHVGVAGHTEKWWVYQQDFPDLWGPHWDSVIADECDRYLLGVRTLSGKMPLWAEGLVRINADRKIAVTGTPFNGSEMSIFGILHWLNKRVFSAKWKFANVYFDVTTDQYDQMHIGELIKPKEFGLLLDQWSIRRTRQEVRDDLPDQIHQSHWVEMPPKHRKQYQTFEEQGWVQMSKRTISSKGVLGEITRLRQLSFGEFEVTDDAITPVQSAKLDLVKAMLNERGVFHGRGQMKYIIASQFTKILNWIESQFEVPVLKITGEVSGKQRDEVVRDFQSEGGPRVLLLNTVSGVSITLDRWCDEMFILDEMIPEAKMIQLRGRIDNRGDRVAPRTYHYIRTRSTIEERISEELITMAERQGEVLDGRRGVEVLSKLYGRK